MGVAYRGRRLCCHTVRASVHLFERVAARHHWQNSDKVMDTLLVVHVLVSAVILVVVVSIALITRAKGRRGRCAVRKTTLLRGSLCCPRCGSGPGRDADRSTFQETCGLSAGSFELGGAIGSLSPRRISIPATGARAIRPLSPWNRVAMSSMIGIMLAASGPTNCGYSGTFFDAWRPHLVEVPPVRICCRRRCYTIAGTGPCSASRGARRRSAVRQ
jgi:hypothetical protein